MAGEAIAENVFWDRLAHETCLVIQQDGNLPRLEHFWIDSFVPDRPLAVVSGCLKGHAWVMEHEDVGKAFTRYTMKAVLGERAQAAFTRGEGYADLVPDETRTDWLTFDADGKHVTISLD
ncbi:MAG TPA: hypothetical protein VNZ85_09885 [Caulobacter sp.]|nr:hypothetical protein [Caulobacter sp.]